jgi:hypothetical protein
VQGRIGGSRGEVVVIDERQVRLIGGQQLHGFGGLVLAEQQADPRMSCRQSADSRQQVCAEGGTESGDPQSAAWFCLRPQVELRCFDRGEDRHGMLGQPPAGRCQPDPAPGWLDERSTHLAGEDGDLLRNRGGGGAEHVGYRTHRAQP